MEWYCILRNNRNNILVDCVQTSVKDALLNISTSPFLAIPSISNMPQLISKFSIADGDQTTGADNPPHDDDEGVGDEDDDLCQSLDRLATRRVTDFSQVKKLSQDKIRKKQAFILF